MENTFNPNMLMLARQSKGFKQRELADLLGVSQALISKAEKGDSTINDEILGKISVLLDYPKTFFYDNTNIPFGFYLYRKYSNIHKGQLESIVANLKINLIHIQKLYSELELEKEDVIYMSPEEFGTPDEIAYYLREKFRIPPGPIKSMTEFIERFGVLVLPVNITNRMFSGLTVPFESQNFVIFVNKNMPHDRLRFTLAHEFAHIIMHANKKIFSDKYDDEANLFASAFLMPEYDIEDDLKNVDIDKLALLKLYWNVSMSSILIRAHQLRKITDDQYTKIYKLMSKLGYKREEPVDVVVPEENPTLLNEILDSYRIEFSYKVEDFCELLNCTIEYFKRTYLNVNLNMKLATEIIT